MYHVTKQDEFVTFELQLWRSIVVFFAQKGCVLESLMDDTLVLSEVILANKQGLEGTRQNFHGRYGNQKHLQFTLRINHSYPLGLLVSARGEKQDVLVDEHPEGDEGHVEPVQEVLDGNIHVLLNMLLVVELKDTLRQKELPVKRKEKRPTFAICQTTSLLSFFIVSRALQKFRNVPSSNSAESNKRSCSKLRQNSSCGKKNITMATKLDQDLK